MNEDLIQKLHYVLHYVTEELLYPIGTNITTNALKVLIYLDFIAPCYICSILADMLHHLLFLYTCQSTKLRKNPGEVSKSHSSPS